MVRVPRVWKTARSLWLIFGLLISSLISPLAVSGAVAADPEILVVPVGESRIIATANLERVAVADPTVADVVVASTQEVLVNGKKAGVTSLHLWEGGQRRSFLVRVEADLETVARVIAEALNDPAVQVKAVRGAILLEGTVADRAAADRAEKVARAYADKVVNLLRVPAAPAGPAEPVAKPEGPTPEQLAAPQAEKDRQATAEQAEKERKAAAREALPGQVEAAIGVPTVKASLIGEVLILDGTVPTKESADRAKTIAEAFATGVVGKVSVTLGIVPEEPPQVLLQVKVAEVYNDSLNQLGIGWGTIMASATGTGQFVPGVTWVGELAVDTPMARLTPLSGQLDVLFKEGSAKLLAAPSIVTRSGKQAEFLAGGEIPVVVYNKDAYTVYWKEYGVKLSMLPEVRPDGQILVHLKPEVSTLDWASGAKINNGLFPALKTRRAETDVRLRDGATLVIGGLLNNEEARNSQGLPGLSKLPIIGYLFASKGFQKGQTQLVIFVTPRLLKDGDSPQVPEITTGPPPTDETLAPIAPPANGRK